MKRVAALLSVVMMATVIGCGAKGVESEEVVEKNKAVTEYTGSEFNDLIPSTYYNLMDQSPMINHTNFVELEREISSREDYSYNTLEASMEVMTDIYGEPTIIQPSKLLVGEGHALYSTAFGNVCVILNYRDLGTQQLVGYAVSPAEYQATPDELIEAVSVSEELRRRVGYFRKKSYDEFSMENLKTAYGASVINTDALYKDYSGMTYSQIAEELGSTGFLNSMVLCVDNNKVDIGDPATIVATWYCPEEDSLLTVEISYTVKDIANWPNDYYAEYRAVEDVVQNKMFYEKETVTVVTRTEFDAIRAIAKYIQL